MSRRSNATRLAHCARATATFIAPHTCSHVESAQRPGLSRAPAVGRTRVLPGVRASAAPPHNRMERRLSSRVRPRALSLRTYDSQLVLAHVCTRRAGRTERHRQSVAHPGTEAKGFGRRDSSCECPITRSAGSDSAARSQNEYRENGEQNQCLHPRVVRQSDVLRFSREGAPCASASWLMDDAPSSAASAW